MKREELKTKFEQAQDIRLDTGAASTPLAQPDGPQDELYDSKHGRYDVESEARVRVGKAMSFEELKRRFEQAQEVKAEEVAVDQKGSSPPLLPSGRLEEQPSKDAASPDTQPPEIQSQRTYAAKPRRPRPQPRTQYTGLKTIIVVFVIGIGMACALLAMSEASPRSVATKPTYPPEPTSSIRRPTRTPNALKVTPATAEALLSSAARAATPTPGSQAQDHPKPAATPAPTATPKRSCPGVQFKLGICLVSGELAKLAYRPGETISGSLIWTTGRHIRVGYTVFVHLTPLDNTTPVVQHDGLPANGTRPTDTWQPGEEIHDPHQLVLPSNIPPGQYLFRVGMYEGGNGPRLQVVDSGGATVADNAVILGPIWVNN